MIKSNAKVTENDKNKNLIKTLLVFLSYFLYTNVVSSVLSAIGVTDSTVISFTSDIIFFVGIMYAYKENLKRDFLDLKSNYKISKIIKTIILWVGVIFVSNILMGALTEMISPNMAIDDNTNAIFSVSKISTVYAIFKTMIFAVVAEELLFRESIGDVVNSTCGFVFASSTIYTIMNFIYSGFSSKNLIIYLLIYFVPALILSTAYVKNNRNIFVLMLIKFVYQLIPLTILLLGL